MTLGRYTALVSLLFLASCSGTTEQNLFVNLFEVGADPFENVTRFQAEVDTDGTTYPLDGFDSQDSFGPLGNGAPSRIELDGLDTESRRVAWGFSPLLHLGTGARKTTVFFSREDTTVAHAGPGLVDPEEGLSHTGLPVSLRTDSFKATLAYNQTWIYLDMEVDDDIVVSNEDDPFAGDLVVLVLDPNGDTSGEAQGPDDYVLVFGDEKVVKVRGPPVQGNNTVLTAFTELDGGGYRVFAAIPVGNQGDVDSPGPDVEMKLGIEVRDTDVVGEEAAAVSSWPPAWAGAARWNPPADVAYTLDDAGSLFFKTRALDAREVPRNSVDFDEGIDAFLDSGAVPLSRAQTAGEDDVRAWALWDNAGIYIAVQSDDDVFCTQERQQGDRSTIMRDDAVELMLSLDDVDVYRAIFNLTGSTSFDQSSLGTWPASEIYFRFDLDGPLPDNDCQAGNGFTFKVRIPWTDLGIGGTPPDLGDLFGFDLVVYDNDRGAHAVIPFSPLGPSDDPQALAELRLFAY